MDLVGIAGDVLQELESSEGKFSCVNLGGSGSKFSCEA